MQKTFKSILGGLLLSLVIGTTCFMSSSIAFAQDNPESNGFYNDETQDVLKSFQEESGFNSFVGDSTPVKGEGTGGVRTITNLLATIIAVVKYIVGGLAVLLLVISIMQLILAPPDKSEEKYTDLKKHIGYIVVAVIVIISADTLFGVAFDVSGSGFLASENAAKTAALAGAAEIRGIYNIIESIIGVIAVMMLVIAGFRLSTNAGNEEALSKTKTQIMYAAFGLILIAVSEFVVKDILFKEAGTTLGIAEAKLLLVKFTNFASGFISFTAVLSLFYAGYLYIFSGVGEDNSAKIKSIVLGAVIGILIAAGAFGIVNTFVELDGTNSPSFAESQLDNL